MVRLILAMLIARKAPASEGVVLLHGLARSSRSMSRIEHSLLEAGFLVRNLDYPSTKFSISELATQLQTRILSDRDLQACERIHFVTHSMGGIVVRYLMSKNAISKVGRVVMLGPPNGGSEVVDRIGSWRLFKFLNGPAGQELGTGPESTPNRIGPVMFELGIIAGDRSINWINSSMIEGPDDGKVSVERTKVAGMKDHVVLHTTHPTMLLNREVIAHTLRFLRFGSF